MPKTNLINHYDQLTLPSSTVKELEHHLWLKILHQHPLIFFFLNSAVSNHHYCQHQVFQRKNLVPSKLCYIGTSKHTTLINLSSSSISLVNINIAEQVLLDTSSCLPCLRLPLSLQRTIAIKVKMYSKILGKVRSEVGCWETV